MITEAEATHRRDARLRRIAEAYVTHARACGRGPIRNWDAMEARGIVHANHGTAQMEQILAGCMAAPDPVAALLEQFDVCQIADLYH